jgi:hypothetical protein
MLSLFVTSFVAIDHTPATFTSASEIQLLVGNQNLERTSLRNATALCGMQNPVLCRAGAVSGFAV